MPWGPCFAFFGLGVLVVLVLMCDDAVAWLLALLLLVPVLVLTPSSSTEPIVTGGRPTPAKPTISIFDPQFNLREIAKQLALLEDHLFHKNKHCVDCISKHFLTIEGFAEEARTLDKDRQYGPEIDGVLRIREVMPPFISKMKDKAATEEDFSATAQAVRAIRKPLAVKYSNVV